MREGGRRRDAWRCEVLRTTPAGAGVGDAVDILDSGYVDRTRRDVVMVFWCSR